MFGSKSAVKEPSAEELAFNYACTPPAFRVPTFEYFVGQFDDTYDTGAITTLVNRLGAAGWELVASATRADAPDSTIGMTAFGMTTAVKAPKGGARGVFLLTFKRRTS